MPDVQRILENYFISSLAAALGPSFAKTDPLIRPSNNPKFGDYQSNVAMSLAKKVKQKPRDVAQMIVDRLDADHVCEHVEIAGPGFINLRLRNTFLSEQIAAMAADERLGVPLAESPMNVVVDYSSPNAAKEMHVGHLRSTIIGDAIVRVLSFLGHQVIRQNHLGDWGTQFGMLIQYLMEGDDIADFRSAGVTSFSHGIAARPSEVNIRELDLLYRVAKQKFDTEPDFAERARHRVVQLQSGDESTHQVWQALVDESKRHFNELYERLGVLLSDDDVVGESFYNLGLAAVVQDLEQAGLLAFSQGAKVVFPKGFVDHEGQPLPMIIQKGDGGYLYPTTDLAAVRYRISKLGANRLIYVVDARQADHFGMWFTAAREARWVPVEVSLEHVAFGTILGKDRTPFKTREGGTIRLSDVLDEGVRRAEAIIEQKNPDLPEKDRRRIAEAVGIGAIKYADLSNDRIKDYVFDWDRMLSFDGNTAPYLQNAYVRIRSIFRKVARGQVRSGQALDGLAPETASGRGGGFDREIDSTEFAAVSRAGPIKIEHAAERALAIRLLQMPQTIRSVAESLEPHRLCTWLYELASSFHQFYEQCPVLAADTPAVRESRLGQCGLAARTIQGSLDLLGIPVIEQM